MDNSTMRRLGNVTTQLINHAKQGDTLHTAFHAACIPSSVLTMGALLLIADASGMDAEVKEGMLDGLEAAVESSARTGYSIRATLRRLASAGAAGAMAEFEAMTAESALEQAKILRERGSLRQADLLMQVWSASSTPMPQA